MGLETVKFMQQVTLGAWAKGVLSTSEVCAASYLRQWPLNLQKKVQKTQSRNIFDNLAS